MKKEEFLEKLQIELKISKNSNYTLRNYLNANESLLDFIKKSPDKITQDDVKLFLAEKLSSRASSSIIIFLSAIKYAYGNILKKDPTINIKRPKRERKIPVVLTKEELEDAALKGNIYAIAVYDYNEKEAKFELSMWIKEMNQSEV